MENVGHGPEFDPSVHEKMSLYALILNVHEMMGTARRLDANLKGEMQAEQRPAPAHRFMMTEVPLPSVPAERQILPVRAHRAVLRPKRSAENEGKLLIVRVPIEDEHQDTPKDTFIELVDAVRGRWQFLLNGEGLWQYDNVTDLATRDGRHFRLKEESQPESSLIMEQLSRYIAGSRIELQTSFYIDPE